MTPEERAEAMRKLEASTKRSQDQAERVRTHKEREERCRQQREIERRNREAKAARKAEHERIQQEIAAREAALIAQGITPESRSERKRRLAREATEHTARKAQGPRPAPDRPAVQGFPRPAPRPARDETDMAEHPARTPDHTAPAPDRPMPQVEFKKKRRVVLPPDER